MFTSSAANVREGIVSHILLNTNALGHLWISQLLLWLLPIYCPRQWFLYLGFKGKVCFFYVGLYKALTPSQCLTCCRWWSVCPLEKLNKVLLLTAPQHSFGTTFPEPHNVHILTHNRSRTCSCPKGSSCLTEMYSTKFKSKGTYLLWMGGLVDG